MAVYQNSEQLDQVLKAMFVQVSQDQQAVQKLVDAKLIIRLRLSDPALDLVVNGRYNPPKVIYGVNSLKPDLDILLPTDALHEILLGTLPLGRAWSSGVIKVNGPLLKSYVMADIFHSGQHFYPQIAREHGVIS